MIKPPRGTQLNFAHPLNRGLVACYDFNELSGDILNDISSYKNNGAAINSPSWVPSPIGGALDFDPTSEQYVDCGTAMGTALGTVSALSLSMWFKLGINSSSLKGLFSISALDATAGQFNLRFAENELLFLMSFNAFNHGIVWTDTTSYHHLIAEYTGSRGILTIDNVEVINEAFATNLILGGLKTWLGVYNTSTRSFNGQIGQVRIYNRTIQPYEVSQLGNLPPGVYL